MGFSFDMHMPFGCFMLLAFFKYKNLITIIFFILKPLTFAYFPIVDRLRFLVPYSTNVFAISPSQGNAILNIL